MISTSSILTLLYDAKRCVGMILSVALCFRIVVLDKGEVVEVGAPKELLEIPDGWFASMANDADISG